MFAFFGYFADSQSLGVRDEWVLYLTIRNYIQATGIGREELAPLVGQVRFRWMDHKQLEVVVADGYASDGMLVPALMERLRLLEYPKAPPSAQPSLQRRLANGIEFEHIKDYDGQGSGA